MERSETVFLLLQVANEKLIEQDSGLSIKRSYGKSGCLVALLDKRVRSLDHEDDIPLRKNG